MVADNKKINNRDSDNIGSQVFGEEILPSEIEDDRVEVSPDSDLVTAPEGEADDGSQYISSIKKTLKSSNQKTGSPSVSADDIYSDLENADIIGEESSLGDNPTPDQDQIESIGEPWGIEYDENEDLNVSRKIRQREKERIEDEDEISHRSA